MACPGTVWGYTLPPATSPSLYVAHMTARDEWKAYDPASGRVTLLSVAAGKNTLTLAAAGVTVDFTQDGGCNAAYVTGGAPCVYQTNPFGGETMGYAEAGSPGVFPDFTSTGLDASHGSVCCGTTVTNMGSCPVQHNQFSDLPASLTQVAVLQALNVPGKFFVKVANAVTGGYSAPTTYELADGATTVMHSFEYPAGVPYSLQVDFHGAGAAAKFPAAADLTLGKVTDKGALYNVGVPVTFADFSQSGLPLAAGMALCCAGGASPAAAQYSVRFVPDGADLDDESKHAVLCASGKNLAQQQVRLFTDASGCTPMVVTIEGSGYDGVGPGFVLRDTVSGLYLDAQTGVPTYASGGNTAALVYYNSANHMWPVASQYNIGVATGTDGYGHNTMNWAVMNPTVYAPTPYTRVYLKELPPAAVRGAAVRGVSSSSSASASASAFFAEMPSAGVQNWILLFSTGVVVVLLVYLYWRRHRGRSS